MTLATHIARKDHSCTLCGQKIPQGDRYWREDEDFGDGDIVNIRKEHTNCELYKREATANE